jgi:hypothetical protein
LLDRAKSSERESLSGGEGEAAYYEREGRKEEGRGTGQVMRVKCETVCGKASVKNRVHREKQQKRRQAEGTVYMEIGVDLS